MKQLINTFSVLLLLTQTLPAQAVDPHEILRRGNSVQRTTPGHFAQGPDLAALAPPADDSHKWFISIITQEYCAPCKKLLADLRSEPALRAWANLDDTKQSWSHVNLYHSEDATQAWRWKNIVVTGYPTLLLQPPRNGKFGDPATVVLQKTGYNGDAAKLAEQLRSAVLAHAQQLPTQPAPTNAPHQACAPQDQTLVSVLRPATPTIAPPFTPPQMPDILPELLPPSVVPPAVDPDAVKTPASTPTDAADKRPVTGPFPQHPEAVVVVDKFADSVADETSFNRIRAVLQRLQRERPGLTVRLLDVRDAANYPVDRSELPAVITTSEGRIETKLDRSLLPILAADGPAFPWQALLTMLTQGFNWAGMIAIGVWAVAMIRRVRQARGKRLLLDDEMLVRVRELIEKMSVK